MKMRIPTVLVPMLALALLPALSHAVDEEAMPWTTPPSVYLGFGSPCEVVAREWWNAGEVRSFPVRAVCGLPEQAVAVLLEVRSEALESQSPAVKLWSGPGAEPAAAVLPGVSGRVGAVQRGLTLVPLCAQGCGAEEVWLRSDATAYLDVAVVGYFRPLAAGTQEAGAEDLLHAATVDAGAWLQPLATEGASNNFFGTGAGANTTGAGNSFFGGSAGNENTSGYDNAFFGHSAGLRNTEGYWNAFFGTGAGFNNGTAFNNAFFGHAAGFNNTFGGNNTFLGFNAGASNTMGNNNTFVGASSTGVVGISNATAVGAFSKVTQSNSLVLGSIAGENFAAASVNVGIGVAAPERQLHIRGENAQVRIDRPVDATSFQLVRTNAQGDVLKSFVFGVLASGPDNGSFFIRDNAQQTSGATDRVRMQINNAGNTTFQGTVSAVAFNSASAARFKTDITTLSNADASLQRLRGVRFHWKENGTPSLGLIAEEVAEVFPELVERDAQTGEVEAVNYPALVAVLIEGYKGQQERLVEQEEVIAVYQSRVEDLEQQQVVQQQQLAELATLRAQVAAIERLLMDSQPLFAQR